MGVLRRENTAGGALYSFADIEHQANELMSRAREKAKSIIAESEGHIRAVTEAQKREGYQAGYTEGTQAGFEQARHDAREECRAAARAELDQLMAAMKQGLGEFESNKRRLIAVAEAGLVELAVAIARRVCKVHIDASHESVVANARAVLDMVRHENDLELRVNPTEHELLQEHTAELMRNMEQWDHVSIVADPAVARGGCLLRTRHGTIDASIDGQLDRIARVLCRHEDPAADGAAS